MKKISHTALISIATLLLFAMFFGKIYTHYLPFCALLVISFTLSLVSLFLIHHPALQLRFCLYAIILLFAFQGWIIYVLASLTDNPTPLPVTALFPIIAAIVLILAITIMRRREATKAFLGTLKRNIEKVDRTKGNKGK